MASSALLRRRPWPPAARAIAVIVIAIATAVAGIPVVQAKRHGQGQGQGGGQGHSRPQSHRNPTQPPKHNPARQGQSSESKEPVAQPAIVTPPATPAPAKPAPSRPSPKQPARTHPAPTSPGRSPVARRRRAVSRERQRRASSPAGRARRGSGSVKVNRASGSVPTTAAGGVEDGAGGVEDGARGKGASGGARAPKRVGDQNGSTVTRTVRDIVEVVPSSLKKILAALAALTVLLGVGSLLSTLRARRLDRQRRELLQEVGLLQSALLPPVPPTVGALRTSVAYQPAEGAAAGGDFYDALTLPDGKAVFILGDVSGHGRGALERTAFLRYTLRAYLEAGLAPRVALQIAGRVIDDQLGGDFATVLLAVHDPATGSLTYSSAGHPAPIVVGPSAYQPVLAASSPPVGVGLRTGLRQTTVPLAPGSVACLYTDGLTEARTDKGILGRGRLGDLLEKVGRDGEARELLQLVADDSRQMPDDMAVCLFTPTAGVTSGGFRSELLELSADELESDLGRRFLEACGVGEDEVERALDDAGFLATRFDQVVLHVVFGNRLTVEALPANVETIQVAARRALAS